MAPKRRSALSVGLLLAIGIGFLAIAISNTDQIQQLALGVGGGALIAAIAIAVTLNFQGSGVVNFSAGAMAMYSGYLYNALRTQGKLLIPPLPNPLAPIEGLLHLAGAKSVNLPDWPTFITLAHPGQGKAAYGTFIQTPAMAVWLAVLITLAVAALMGLAFHYLIFRPLRNAPVLAKVVSSVGLFIALQAIVVLRFGASPKAVASAMPSGTLRLPRGVEIPYEQLIMLCVVLATTLVLWLVFRYSRFGLATRAASENEKGAQVLGYSPDFLAGVNWVVSTVVVSLFGILAAMVNQSIDTYTVTLLVVPALAAALLARFNSFIVTLLAGLAIGMGQSWLDLIANKDWFPKSGGSAIPGLTTALPFLVIIIVLAFRGQSIPTRGSVETIRMPFAPRASRPVLTGAVLSVAVLATLFLASSNWRMAMTNSIVGIVFCLSLVVLTGYVGQISLMQMTLAGVSGFVLSKVADVHHVPFPFGPLLGALVAMVVGLLAGLPALRVRGVNLAVVTFAAAVTLESLVLRNPAWSGLKGASVNPPKLFGAEFGPNNPWTTLSGHPGPIPNPWFGVFCLVVALALVAVVVNLRNSRTGRHMLAVRSNERAAAAAGVSVPYTKIVAFGLSAFIAGLGGALSGYRFGSVTADYFGAVACLVLLAFAYLGGISSVSGAVLGGMLVTGGLMTQGLDAWLHLGGQYSLLIAGVGLIFTAVMNPEGVAGSLRDAVALGRSKFPSKAEKPSEVKV